MSSREGDARARRTRRGLFGGLALLAVLAILLLLRSTRAPAPAEPGPVVAREAPTHAAPPLRGPVGPQPKAPTGTPAPSDEALVDPRTEQATAPTPQTGASPYPPGSQPLNGTTNPSLQPPEDDPVDAEQGIHVVFGPRVAVLHPPDAVVIDLEVLNKLGAHMPVTGALTRFRPENGSPERGPWFTAPLVDDGSGADLAPSDLKYTATFVPTPEQQAALLAGGTHVVVEVAFEAPKGLGPRKYATGVHYSREPSASLNGKYTDALVDGSLVIRAGVTATQPGDYRVIGSLYAGDEPIAWGAQATTLPEGDGWIPLLFFGKILHDRGLDGPYELRFVMLSQHAGPDIIPGDTVDPAYTTQAYAAKSFSPDPYVPPPPPPAVFDDQPAAISLADRDKLSGATAPIRADPTNRAPQPVPAGTK